MLLDFTSDTQIERKRRKRHTCGRAVIFSLNFVHRSSFDDAMDGWREKKNASYTEKMTNDFSNCVFALCDMHLFGQFVEVFLLPIRSCVVLFRPFVRFSSLTCIIPFVLIGLSLPLALFSSINHCHFSCFRRRCRIALFLSINKWHFKQSIEIHF